MFGHRTLQLARRAARQHDDGSDALPEDFVLKADDRDLLDEIVRKQLPLDLERRDLVA